MIFMLEKESTKSVKQINDFIDATATAYNNQTGKITFARKVN